MAILWQAMYYSGLRLWAGIGKKHNNFSSFHAGDLLRSVRVLHAKRRPKFVTCEKYLEQESIFENTGGHSTTGAYNLGNEAKRTASSVKTASP